MKDIEVYRMKAEPEAIFVSLQDIPGTISMLDGNALFRLDKDQADRLAFHLNSELQDMERRNG